MIMVTSACSITITETYIEKANVSTLKHCSLCNEMQQYTDQFHNCQNQAWDLLVHTDVHSLTESEDQQLVVLSLHQCHQYPRPMERTESAFLQQTLRVREAYLSRRSPLEHGSFTSLQQKLPSILPCSRNGLSAHVEVMLAHWKKPPEIACYVLLCSTKFF